MTILCLDYCPLLNGLNVNNSILELLYFFRNKEEEYEKEFTKDFIQTNENKPEEIKQIKFYHLFDITEDKYNENNFQVSSILSL